MELFSKYFRRLLQGNHAQIFSPTGRPAEPSSPYHLLVGEMQRLRHDPQQAEKIAESIDTTEGDLFRDFDLSGFMDHFKLDAISRFSLSLALKDASKPDLRSKGEVTSRPHFRPDLYTNTFNQPKPFSRNTTCHFSNLLFLQNPMPTSLPPTLRT